MSILLNSISLWTVEFLPLVKGYNVIGCFVDHCLFLSGLFLTELCFYAYVLKHLCHISKCYFRFWYLCIYVYVRSFIWLFCCIWHYIYVKILVSGNDGYICSFLFGCVHLFLYVFALVLITCFECLCSCQWVRVQFDAHLISPFFYLKIIHIESYFVKLIFTIYFKIKLLFLNCFASCCLEFTLGMYFYCRKLKICYWSWEIRLIKIPLKIYSLFSFIK